MKTVNDKGNRIFGHPYASKKLQKLVDKICFNLLEKNILINGENPLDENRIGLSAHIGNKEVLIEELKEYGFKFEKEGEWFGHYVHLKKKETILQIRFYSNRVKIFVPKLVCEPMEEVFKRTYAQTFKQSQKGVLPVYK